MFKRSSSSLMFSFTSTRGSAAATASPLADPPSMTPPGEAMKQLRQWKHAAREASHKDKMTLESPDYEKVENKYKDFSYLQSAMKQPQQSSTGEDGRELSRTAWQVVDALTKSSVKADRAVGALYGLTLGDAFGAPMEFLPVDPSIVPPARDGSECCETGSFKLHFLNWIGYPARNRRSHAFFDRLNDKGEIDYFGSPFGKGGNFGVAQGQFTDDSSMAFCLADSLLHVGKRQKKLASDGRPLPAYDGGDCRIRYFNWWCCGINNAFRFDPDQTRSSIGLGGNIAKSFITLGNSVGLHKTAEAVPPEVGDGNEAGVGAQMRLAPVPIRFASDPVEAMKVAAMSSRATHPSPDAEACCAFQSYFIAKAISSSSSSNERTLSQFVDAEIQSFLKEVPAIVKDSNREDGYFKVQELLQCRPHDATVALWYWKKHVLPVRSTIMARGESWNGFPVLETYFGSYCADALAMALWSMHHDVSLLEKHRAHVENESADLSAIKPARPERFEDVLSRVVNLCGDADSTGAVACQCAGAFFGFQHIMGSDVGSGMVSLVRRWDPFSEIPLRALMLADDGGLMDDIIGPDVEVE